LADPASAHIRFKEVPESSALLHDWEAGAFSLSQQQMVDIIGGPAGEEQLGTPVVTPGTVELHGETLATLNFGFGSSVQVSLVFGEGGAESADGPGSTAFARTDLLGGLLELHSDGGERLFLMDYGRSDPDRHGASPAERLIPADLPGNAKSSQLLAGARPAVGGNEPTKTEPLAETNCLSLATFIAGCPDGKQIAGGFVSQGADDGGANGTAEVAGNAPGNPADVLFTVDTVLPDAKADLVRMQNADLTIVPTYLVGDAPASPVAPPRADDRPDLSLSVQVVGLDESAGDLGRAHLSADRLFEQLASVDGEGNVEASSLAAPGVQPDGIEVGDAAHATGDGLRMAGLTDGGPALRQWLDGLLQQGGYGAAVVAALGLEGLLAYVIRRGWQRGREVPGAAPRRPDRRSEWFPGRNSSAMHEIGKQYVNKPSSYKASPCCEG
jgi:hypothetical protein